MALAEVPAVKVWGLTATSEHAKAETKLKSSRLKSLPKPSKLASTIFNIADVLTPEFQYMENLDHTPFFAAATKSSPA